MDIYSIILYVGMPTVSAMVGYILKNLMTRIENLERQTSTLITEPQVRQIIFDKIEPISSNIETLNNKMDRLLDLYISLVNKK